MRILIVKMSSLGDVINALPAITEAKYHQPSLQFDWLIEPAFAEIPTWHSACHQVITIPLRQWRKNPWHLWRSGLWHQFYQRLRAQQYDLIIDAQGLIKSALFTRLARGLRCGYDWHSAWESLASLVYQRRITVNPKQHAIKRIQQLFAQIFGYQTTANVIDYGLNIENFKNLSINGRYLVLLHGTARAEKQWPEKQWQQLIKYLQSTDNQLLLPWGNPEEYQRALRLAHEQSHVTVLPRCSLTELAKLLANSCGNIAVDTGLGHLAAALGSPTLSLYGPTLPELNGTLGNHQQHLKVNDLATLSAQTVWQQFQILMRRS